MPKLAAKATSVLDKFERKRNCRGAAGAGKQILLVNFKWRYGWYYQNHILTKSIWSINWLYYWNSKTWNKKQECGFLGVMMELIAASLIVPVTSSLINAIIGKGVLRAGKEQEGRFLPLLVLHLTINYLWKMSFIDRKRI